MVNLAYSAGSVADATAGADKQTTVTHQSIPIYADLRVKKEVSLDRFHSMRYRCDNLHCRLQMAVWLLQYYYRAVTLANLGKPWRVLLSFERSVELSRRLERAQRRFHASPSGCLSCKRSPRRFCCLASTGHSSALSPCLMRRSCQMRRSRSGEIYQSPCLASPPMKVRFQTG